MQHNALPLYDRMFLAARANVRRSITVTLIAMGGSSAAIAGPVTYSNPFGDYGTVLNTDCGIGGICGAAEAENSFIFLSKYYPKVYGGTKLTTGNETGANAQSNAAKDFGVNGWMSGGTSYKGFYNRTGGTSIGRYESTLTDWFFSFAPGTSTISTFTNAKKGTKLLDGFLGPELKHHEDIELYIFLPDMSSGHVISPTSITYDPKNKKGCPVCSITYQDPNSPTKQQTAKLTVNGNGYLQFFNSSTFKANVIITAAAAESPKIPEPAPIALLGGGLGLLGWFRWRQPTGRGMSRV